MPSRSAFFSPEKPIIHRGICECGCGGSTKIAPRDRWLRGWVKGEPIRFIPYHHRRISLPVFKINDVSGCWLWQGTLLTSGYGKVSSDQLMAHRVFYEKFKGPIPRGLELDHLCRVRSCVNPDHLEAVTHQENVRRGELWKVYGLRTHCKNGHEFVPSNLYPSPKGEGRRCRKCAQINALRSLHKRKESHAQL